VITTSSAFDTTYDTTAATCTMSSGTSSCSFTGSIAIAAAPGCVSQLIPTGTPSGLPFWSYCLQLKDHGPAFLAVDVLQRTKKSKGEKMSQPFIGQIIMFGAILLPGVGVLRWPTAVHRADTHYSQSWALPTAATEELLLPCLTCAASARRSRYGCRAHSIRSWGERRRPERNIERQQHAGAPACGDAESRQCRPAEPLNDPTNNYVTGTDPVKHLGYLYGCPGSKQDGRYQHQSYRRQSAFP